MPRSKTRKTKDKAAASKADKGKDVKCPKCDNSLDDGTDALYYELCDTWYCLGCSRVSKRAYDELNQQDSGTENFLFTCDPCKKTLPTLKEMRRISQESKKELGEITKKLTDFETKIEKVVEQEVKKTLSSGFMKDLIAEQVEKSLGERLFEKEDREARESNVIVFKVPEPEDDDPAQRQAKDIGDM
jgi:hypothetical protein